MADDDHTATIIITTTTTTSETELTTTIDTEPVITTVDPIYSPADDTITTVADADVPDKRLLRLFFKKKGQNAFCCVPTCKNSSKKNPNLHFHTFPKEGKTILSGEHQGENLRKLWLSQIRRLTFRITKDTLVCSQHFNSADYKPRTKRNKLYGQPGHSHRLLDNAYPTLFNWNNWGKGKKPRHESLKDETQPDDTSCPDDVGTKAGLVNKLSNGPTATKSKLKKMKLPVIDMMHNYSLPSELDNAHGVIRDLRTQIDQTKVENLRFSLARYSNDNAIIEHYTGFASYDALTKFFKTLEEWEHASIMRSKIRINNRSTEELQPVGSEKGLELIEQFVLYQMYVYRGLSEMDLATRFIIPVATVMNIIITWADILFFFLGVWTVWPSREQVRESMLPSIFQDSKYADIRVVFECAELRNKDSSTMLLKSQSYKDYKSSYAYKGLIGLAPNGTVTVASRLLTHSLSDAELLSKSGILQLCEKGDAVLIDEDFAIGDVCTEQGIKMYHSPYKNGEPYTQASEVVSVEEVAWLRTYVDPVVKRIHENVLFHQIPNSMKDTISQMWVVACLLCNFQNPVSDDNSNDNTCSSKDDNSI